MLNEKVEKQLTDLKGALTTPEYTETSYLKQEICKGVSLKNKKAKIKCGVDAGSTGTRVAIFNDAKDRDTNKVFALPSVIGSYFPTARTVPQEGKLLYDNLYVKLEEIGVKDGERVALSEEHLMYGSISGREETDKAEIDSTTNKCGSEVVVHNTVVSTALCILQEILRGGENASSYDVDMMLTLRPTDMASDAQVKMHKEALMRTWRVTFPILDDLSFELKINKTKEFNEPTAAVMGCMRVAVDNKLRVFVLNDCGGTSLDSITVVNGEIRASKATTTRNGGEHEMLNIKDKIASKLDFEPSMEQILNGIQTGRLERGSNSYDVTPYAKHFNKVAANMALKQVKVQCQKNEFTVGNIDGVISVGRYFQSKHVDTTIHPGAQLGAELSKLNADIKNIVVTDQFLLVKGLISLSER